MLTYFHNFCTIGKRTIFVTKPINISYLTLTLDLYYSSYDYITSTDVSFSINKQHIALKLLTAYS